MNLIDLIILIPIAIGAFAGFRKGFILEIVTLLALIIAVIGGFHFLHWGIEVLVDNFQLSGRFLPFLSFFLIFAGIVAFVVFIGKVIKKVVHMAFLGIVDRIAGAVFGALKLVFFFSILIWAFQAFGVEIPTHLQEDSFFYPILVSVAPVIVDLFGYIIPASSELLDEISSLLGFSK